MSTSRRSFLRGRFHSEPDAIRPPWAIDTGAFEDTCTGCGDCVKACPTGILASGSAGFPAVDFARGECTFCADCVSACMPQALRRSSESLPPWHLKASIGDSCLARHGVECRICGELCAPAAIRFRPVTGGVAQAQFDADRCTGCGACQAPCPVGAIALENEVEKCQ